MVRKGNINTIDFMGLMLTQELNPYMKSIINPIHNDTIFSGKDGIIHDGYIPYKAPSTQGLTVCEGSDGA